MDRFVIEPISANSLEVRLTSAPASRPQSSDPAPARRQVTVPMHVCMLRMGCGCWQCMATGAKTCFKEVKSVTFGDAMARDRSVLPEEWASASFCDEYDFRCGACARTWSRPHAQDNLMCASMQPPSWMLLTCIAVLTCCLPAWAAAYCICLTIHSARY